MGNSLLPLNNATSSSRNNSILLHLLVIFQMTSNESYIAHPLNNSKTKQTHCFPKQSRFIKQQRVFTESFYDLPSTQTKRTTGFGFGRKASLASKNSSPPPGSYQLPSDFDRKQYKNTSSIAPGRDKITFGSFLIEALKRNKDVPSPDRYDCSAKRNKTGGGLGQRINTDFMLKYKRSIPGPGSYTLEATELHKGSYFLSTFKNACSPRYFSQAKPKPSTKPRVSSTISYNVQQKEPGKYFNSKYKNTLVSSFSRSKRPGLQMNNMLGTPGFKYQLFSQFGA